MVTGKNIEFDGDKMVTEKIAVLGGFSEKHGMEHCLLTEQNVNQDHMIGWATNLKAAPEDYFIVMDNVRFHKGGRFKTVCEEIWKFMVDRGDRKAPRWSRDYATTILASIKPKFVK